MSTQVGRVVRKPLADRLVTEALAIVAADGPQALSLREVQRRAEVSPAAAYRHFRDREALLVAVAQEAAGKLADHVAEDMSPVPADPGDVDAARDRLLSGCRAYLDFATAHPGLYRAVFLSGEQVDELTDPSDRARGDGGVGGYNLLVHAVQAVVTAVGGGTAYPWQPLTVWSTCHGLAMLRLDAALQALPNQEWGAARDQVLSTIIAAVGL